MSDTTKYRIYVNEEYVGLFNAFQSDPRLVVGEFIEKKPDIMTQIPQIDPTATNGNYGYGIVAGKNHILILGKEGEVDLRLFPRSKP